MHCQRRPTSFLMDAAQTYPDKIQGSSLLNEIINPLNAELNPIRHLLALVGARHIVHVSRVRVKPVTGTHKHKPHSQCDQTENYLLLIIYRPFLGFSVMF